MKLSTSGGGDFLPHDDGTFIGVCVDVTPPTTRQTNFGPKEEFRLVFETNAPLRKDGSKQLIWSRGFTPSLNEKASFRKFLRQWNGRDLTAAEEKELDTEAFIGKNASLTIVHEEVGEKVYANIAACTPHKGEPMAATGKFTRKKDKEAKVDQGGEGTAYRGAAKPSEGMASVESIDDTAAGSDWTKVKVHVGQHSGVEMRDLDAEAITKLNENWLPSHTANKKPTADDKRLAAALKLAVEAIGTESSPY